MKELTERKSKNPLFSLRAFARQLKISPAQLSLLMNGKKKLSPKVAGILADRLNLNSIETLELIEDSSPLKQKINLSRSEMQILSDEEFSLISDWVHFAILELSALKNNQANSRWIASELGVDPNHALEAMDRLQGLGFIKIENGRMSKTTKPVTTTTDVPSSAIRKYHKQNLDLAREKIDSVPMELREYATVTTTVSMKKLKRVKKLIQEFRHRINEELEGDEATEVYTLAIQLFPLTKVQTRVPAKGIK
ncbi:MAG: DUF4423 domain-containing protein [Bdellovibrionaceae bacterium]|nr:DUF4423 domain-containing protein [Pseudobdellovibrionaceae bacterium]